MEWLIGTSWKINCQNKDVSDLLILFNGANSIEIMNTVHTGTYTVENQRIQIQFMGFTLNGLVVEDHIFGIGNPSDFEFECVMRSYHPHLQTEIGKNHMRLMNGRDVGEDEEFYLILKVYNEIKDYRLEFDDAERITRTKIKKWINQFEPLDRIPILTELANIFKERYCSKNGVKKFLEQVVTKLKYDFGFSTEVDFLQNANFLNLQPHGKSQRIMLNLFDELIQEKYHISLSECGTVSRKYTIYLDDILCTGLTLISDIKAWSEEIFTVGKTNLEAIHDDSTILVFAYVYIHNKNYHKKVAEMRYKISPQFALKHKMYRLIEIQNGSESNSKLDLVIPLEQGQPQCVLNYKELIIAETDLYTKKYNKISLEEFYRPSGLPSTETFFTSSQNRIILENAFLKKGVEILENANATNKSMRPLGYSIPSLKNFGFGALCFTWRNVPNNTPLVFWYIGGGFTPLFKVVRGSNSIGHSTFGAAPN